MPMWDHLLPRTAATTDGSGGAPPLDRKKLEAWQISRPTPFGNGKSSNTARPARAGGGGVYGGSENYQYSISGGKAAMSSPRPPPGYAPPPGVARNTYRNSAYGRPASSVYSQPSPDAATFAAHQLRNEIVYHDANGVSPPSSPDPLTPRDGNHDAGDVSPIDESPNVSQLTMNKQQQQQGPATRAEPRSSIPTMRRERRRASDAQRSKVREPKPRDSPPKQPRPHGSDVRWDPRTGEPTDSDKGRKSQVNPHEYGQSLTTQGAAPVMPSQVKKTQQSSTPTSLGDRFRKMREPKESQSPQPRPEWKGSSGRSAIVPPVNETPQTPVVLPRKSSKRVPRSSNIAGALSPVSPDDMQMRATPTANDVVPSVDVTDYMDSPGAQTYPSPPFSAGSPSPAPAPASQSAPSPSPTPGLRIPSNDKAIKRKSVAPSLHQPHPSTSSSVYSQHDVPPVAIQAQVPALRTVPQDDWVPPPSRFSITTYATSRDGSSPRQSVDDDAPPVPAPPAQFMESNGANQEDSILNRKRPTITGYENSPRSAPPEVVKIDLNSPYQSSSPQTSQLPGGLVPHRPVQQRAKESTLSVSSIASLDKNLPLAPPEMEPGDRVAQLNTQVTALGNRRINLTKAIKQMTELMPTDNVLASDAVLRKREEEKRKVESLRQELAGIEREMYDIGLKLHRAYKRLDREGDYEPTTLWVRRCTG